tara:strand:+ start:552 stop:725 length:174 start_codon:yes stop_codon:yes gene_type:complete
MRLTKEIVNKSIEIFDKHFPHEKKMPIKEKEKIVRFFLKLHELGVKITSDGKWRHNG